MSDDDDPPKRAAPVVPPMPPATLYATDPARFIAEVEAFILACRAYRRWLDEP